jgi:tetratricopeptide (TPR) repeat protein
MPLLPALTIAAALAGQPHAAASPYLDAVRRYGAGHEQEAISALSALGLRAPDAVFRELDERVCTSAGARACDPRSLAKAGIAARELVDAQWRQLYPRALALHLERLAAIDSDHEQAALTFHQAVVLRLIVRLEQIAPEPGVPDDFVELARAGRRMLLWTLQFLRDEPGLASTIDAFTDAKVKDPELSLARGLLEEWRALPGMVAASWRVRLSTQRASLSAQEERRRLEAALRHYLELLGADPGVLEAHLRAGHLLARLDRPEEARAHLARVAALGPDPRQAYFVNIFLADVHERLGRPVEARALYATALRQWPGAQVPIVALARLRLLDGAVDAARATLEGVHVERDMRGRSDPWMGYVGGQAWRLPGAIKALQRSFEALP